MSASTRDSGARGGGGMAGVLAPVLTPFGPDLAPDAPRWIRHCRWLLEQGCAGLAIFGTTSEANSLSVDERERLLEQILAAGVDPGRLVPGTGCCALPDTIRLTRAAVRAGCAGVLVLPPFYYKGVPDDGLFRSRFGCHGARALRPRSRPSSCPAASSAWLTFRPCDSSFTLAPLSSRTPR